MGLRLIPYYLTYYTIQKKLKMKFKKILLLIPIIICSSFYPIQWKILEIPKSSTPLTPIQKIEIINHQVSMGQEKIIVQIETIIIQVKNKTLQITKDSIYTNYPTQHITIDSFVNFKHTSSEKKCRNIINQIQAQPQIQPILLNYKDSLYKFNINYDLNDKITLDSYSSHGSTHTIKINIYTKDNKKIYIYYKPRQHFPKGPIIGSKYQPNDPFAITNWIYMYKIMNTLIPNHNITNYYFSNSKLEEIINNYKS